MKVFERSFAVPAPAAGESLASHFQTEVADRVDSSQVPCRFAVTKSADGFCECEVGVLEGVSSGLRPRSLFQFTERRAENTGRFVAALVVPTGIGAEIGGHAGDATPVARLLSNVCDQLITHPNVVNASDINEIPENALYVEGSILSRVLMGTAGLRPVRSNRVLVVLDAHEKEIFANAAINAVNAARAAYGLRCPKVVVLDPPLNMRAEYASSGRSSGTVEGLERVIALLEEERGTYDAVAFASVIGVPLHYHHDYFDCDGKMVNPWGGVEALLTHAVSELLNVPSAHSPMFETEDVANFDPGVVEPRLAAEAISITFLQCILKGLQKSPRIVTDSDDFSSANVISAEDISCLVQPDGCIGIPTIAALQQGIPVIAVRENRNLMQNDLAALPWAADQFFSVDNYLEAAGVMTALKAGLTPESVRRPLLPVSVERMEAGKAQDTPHQREIRRT